MRDYDVVLDKIAFAQATEGLAPYFQLTTQDDTADAIALQSIQGFTGLLPNQQLVPPREFRAIAKHVLSTQEGSVTTVDLMRLIDTNVRAIGNRDVGNIAGSTQKRISEFIRIIGPTFANVDTTNAPYYLPNISDMLGYADGTGIINKNPNNPSKEHPDVSIWMVNSVQLMPSHRNTNAITIFMNGLPALELQRAIPFVNIQFLFGRDPLDSDNRLQTLSLFKFLEGATNEGLGLNDANFSAVRRLMVDANSVSGSISGDRSSSGMLATAGMELFCAPQTLLNANETFNPQLRTVPVLDPFRPFLSFKSLTVDLVPAAGLMSYKTAKMEFVLHDRSRLHEIADFIKPDLYGTTELLIEYGWNHPDKPTTSEISRGIYKNPYGILINGMRSREKYSIVNIQGGLNDVGEVTITLDLAMKGSNELFTESIAATEAGTGNILRDIQRLASLVTAYERRLGLNNNETSNGQRAREIRGTQLLAQASDAQGQLQLSPAMLEQLRQLSADLRRGSGANNPNVRNLITSLTDLYTNRSGTTRSTNPNNTTGDGGALARLSTTTQLSIEEKIRQITRSNSDPLLPANVETRSREELVGRIPPTDRGSNGGSRARVNEMEIDRNITKKISLGKLLTKFVAEPLALTNKFDDVQLIFYPFNKYAGKANTMNIGQFIVDTRYFIRQYTRYRTENLARASNMTLKDFMSFIADTLLDDNAAESYGIYSLFRRVLNRTTGEDELTTVRPGTNTRSNTVEFQTDVENILRNQTPNGTFKMPQIECYVECCPGKIIREGSVIGSTDHKSVLRIHVFDRQATSFEVQNNLMAMAREDVLTSIGSLPQSALVTEEGINQSHAAAATSIIDMALAEGLVAPVRNRNGSAPTSYRIKKGPQAIKDFLMSTMPYIIYGVQGTAVKGAASLNTMQDSTLSTVNMLRSFRASPLEANGEQPGGLPLSIIPCELGLPVYGCPLVDFAQQLFIDFQTGTSWDNIYGVKGVSHKLTPGDFTTDIKFVPMDAYGKYHSMIEQVNMAADRLQNLQPQQETT